MLDSSADRIFVLAQRDHEEDCQNQERSSALRAGIFKALGTIDPIKPVCAQVAVAAVASGKLPEWANLRAFYLAKSNPVPQGLPENQRRIHGNQNEAQLGHSLVRIGPPPISSDPIHLEQQICVASDESGIV